MSTRFRYFGLLTVFILWTSFITAIYKAGLDIFGKKPLSSLGVLAESAPFFSIGLILAACTLLLFSLYLNQHYKISRSFWFFLVFGQIGQIFTAIIPYGGEQPARFIHTFSAMILAISLPLLLWRFAKAQVIPTVRFRAYLLMKLELIAYVIGISMFIILFKGAPFAQIIPALAFHSWLIYFSLKPPPDQL